SAALLHEAGADVEGVLREPRVHWLPPSAELDRLAARFPRVFPPPGRGAAGGGPPARRPPPFVAKAGGRSPRVARRCTARARARRGCNLVAPKSTSARAAR